MDLHFTFILMPDEFIMIHLTIMNAKGISNERSITTVSYSCPCNSSLPYFLQQQRPSCCHWQRDAVLLIPPDSHLTSVRPSWLFGEHTA